MKYDFTSILDRNGKDSIAVNPPMEAGWVNFAPVKEGFDLIPMWVADMNFPTVPTIPETITERVKRPAYGYFEPREEYYEGIIHWQKVRNNVMELEKEHSGYENGVTRTIRQWTNCWQEDRR